MEAQDNRRKGQQPGDYLSDRDASIAHHNEKAAAVMRNHLIVPMLARMMPAQNLLHLRQCCRLWTTAFGPELCARNTELGEIILNESGPRPKQKREPGGRLRDFCATMNASASTPPFSRYRILDLDNAYPGSIDEFFEQFGTSMRSLHLKIPFANGFNDCNTCSSGFRRLRQIIFVRATELTDLSITITSVSRNKATHHHVPRIRCIEHECLEPLRLPKLRRLALTTPHIVPPNTLVRLIWDILERAVGLESLVLEDNVHVLENIAHSLDTLSHLGNLKSLVVNRGIGETVEGLRALREWTLWTRNPLCSLRVLHIVIDGVNEQQGIASQVREILRAQAHTLEELQLKICASMEESEPKIPIHIPRMHRLRVLNIHSTILRPMATSFVLSFENGTLLTSVPALKRLDIQDDASWRWTHAGPQDQDLPTWHRLKHDGVTNLVMQITRYRNQGIIKLEPKCLYPALTSLQLDLDACMEYADEEPHWLAGFWAKFPALSLLHITSNKKFSSNWLDESLTGIQTASFSLFDLNVEMRIALQGGMQGQVSMEALKRTAAKYKTGPGLGDLRNLQELVVHGGNDRIFMTDIGGYFGLAMASPTLQRMDLSKAGKNADISVECAAFIRSAFHTSVAILLPIY